MTEYSTDTIDHVTEISDPGERGRENHNWADRLVIRIGNVVAWLFPILMFAIVAQVFMRKAGHNQAWLDDAQWWIYGSALLTGFAYAITTESHVRVDIFHANFSAKKTAKVELFALGWCLLPFIILMTDVLIHYSFASFIAREGSDSPNGLHGLYMLKMLLPVLFILAMVAAISVLSRHLKTLTAPALWSMLLAAFPAAWFGAERVVHYVLWWVVRFTKPDVHPRRIPKDPLLDLTIWYGLAIVIILIVVSFVLTRRSAKEV